MTRLRRGSPFSGDMRRAMAVLRLFQLSLRLSISRAVALRVALAVLVALFALPGLAQADVPTVTAVNPTSGPTTGGTVVTIIGTNFTGVTAVQFGGSFASSFTVISSTELNAATPAGSGTVDVTVTNPDGTSATSAADQYTYVAAPIVGPTSATVAYDSTATPITLNLSGGAITFVNILSQPSHGTAAVSGTSVTYTPRTGYSGADSFTYSVGNNSGIDPSGTVSISVTAPTLSLTPATLPATQADVAYNQSIAASGGQSPYRYAITSGSLPAGLTFNATTGALSGTPTAAGSFTFTVTATDSSTGNGPFSVSQTYTLTVSAPTIAVTPATLPAPVVGTAYSQTLSASGGTAPYVYSVGTGALPPGLSLNSATGSITGTPTAAGSFTFIVQVTDANNFTETTPYAVNVGSAVVSIGPASLSGGVVNAGYSQQLSATGGTAPYTYSVVSGALPAGLSLSSAGVISGTPTTSGSSAFTVQAKDSSGGSGPFTGTRSYVLAIGQTVPVAPPVTVTTQSNAPVTIHATANASGGPFTAVAIATAPGSGTAVVNGQEIVYTPAATSSGNIGFTYTIANSAGVSAPIAVTVTVNAVPVPAAAHQVSTPATQTALIDISDGATGGPFTGAAIVSVSPSSAGTATIVNGTSSSASMKAASAAATQAGQYSIRFVPAAAFAGTAVVSYTLSNSIATSAPGIIDIAVAPRADPSTNPDVVGLIDAQVEAARRFANAQISNYNQRLESLHGTGPAPATNGISVALPGQAPNASAACEDASAPTLRDACLRANQELSSTASTPRDSHQDPATPGNPSQAGESLPNLAFWSAGVVDFGFNNAGTQRSGFRFTTPGVTAGMDYRISDQFSIGAGGGYGHDSTDIGSDGTKSTGDSYSFAVYGSYRPQPALFVDGLAGFGSLNFNSRRWDTDASAFATGQRDGRQTFASLSAGYERHTDSWLISPYARMSYSQATLDSFSESGAGTDSLTYFGQTVTTVSGTLGLRAEYAQPTKWGVLLPYARVEYQHDFNGQSNAGLAYADLAGSGPAYFVTSTPFGQNRTQVGIGSKFRTRFMTLGLDYTVMFGVNSFQQGVRLSLSAPF